MENRSAFQVVKAAAKSSADLLYRSRFIAPISANRFVSATIEHHVGAADDIQSTDINQFLTGPVGLAAG